MADTFGFTDRLLVDAGIVEGMTILDIGSGRGNLSFILSDLVGPTGRVVGIDQSEDAVHAARKRALENQKTNVVFHNKSILDSSGEYDAIVGRRILMYLPNLKETLNHLRTLLKPNGIFVFEEIDATGKPNSVDPCPLHDKVVNWIWRTIEAEGGEINMGFRLPAILEEAGFSLDHIRGEPVIQSQVTGHSLALIARPMLPRFIEHGIVTAADLEIETLQARLHAERRPGVIYVSHTAFGFWGCASIEKSG